MDVVDLTAFGVAEPLDSRFRESVGEDRAEGYRASGDTQREPSEGQTRIGLCSAMAAYVRSGPAPVFCLN